MRSLLSERRSQESAADQAGMKYLEATQAVRPRHARDLRALRPAGVRLGHATRTRSCAATRWRPTASRGCASWWPRAPTSTRRTRPSCSCGMTWCGPRSRATSNGRRRSSTAIRRATQPAGALCARHRAQLLGPMRPGHGRGGGPHQGDARQPLFLGGQGQLLLLERQAPRGDPAAAQGPAAGRRQRAADAGRSWPRRCWGPRTRPLLEEAIVLLRRAAADPVDMRPRYHLLGTALLQKGLAAPGRLATAQGHFAEGNVKQAQMFRQARGYQAAARLAGLASRRRHHQVQATERMSGCARRSACTCPTGDLNDARHHS